MNDPLFFLGIAYYNLFLALASFCRFGESLIRWKLMASLAAELNPRSWSLLVSLLLPKSFSQCSRILNPMRPNFSRRNFSHRTRVLHSLTPNYTRCQNSILLQSYVCIYASIYKHVCLWICADHRVCKGKLFYSSHYHWYNPSCKKVQSRSLFIYIWIYSLLSLNKLLSWCVVLFGLQV